MQLWPELFILLVTMCSAWKRKSASLHGPGATMHGLTPPSSLLNGLPRSGVSSRRRCAACSSVPHTIASWVRSLPVTWMASTPSCAARWPPSAAPPSTNRSQPCSTNSAKTSSKYGRR